MNRVYRILKTFLLVFAVLIVQNACAPTYSLRSEKPVQPISFIFVDQRPETEKVYRPTRASVEQRDSPVIHRFGDKNFKPHRMQVLEGYFQQNLENVLSGRTVTIKRHEVSAVIDHKGLQLDKDRVQKVGIAVGALGIIAYGLIKEQIDSGNKPTDRFFLCEIEGDVEGIEFSAKGSEFFEGVFDYGSAKQRMGNAIYKAMDRAVTEIRKNLKSDSK